ncbi:MAG TPA: FAD-dependent oxidoreductase [Rhodocyclaceae bacterium]
MKYLILGNGPTGVVAAETLRRADPHGEIIMIGCEGEPPYSRMAIPYLLEGNIDESGTHLRKTASHFADLRITQREARAVGLDTAGKKVKFADGSSESYDRLLIATGSHPVRPPIPGIDLPQVQTCWTLADYRNIAALAKPGSRVIQLGAGFIGCIIMEALAKRGVDLTIVEMGDRMVPRMMTPKAGGMIKQWVEDKGIRVRTSAGVERIEANNGAEKGALRKIVDGVLGRNDGEAPLAVKLSTGEVLPCDVLIAAAGVAPNVDFLKGTDVRVGRGITVNAKMETSVPGIYAAGDVTEGPDFFTGEPMVSAIQPNAADQARIAALNMVGKTVDLPGVLAINVLDTLGLISTSFGQWWGTEEKDGVELVDEKNFRYLSLQFKGDVLIGATSIGQTQHVGALRGLIQNRTPLGHWKHVLQETPTRFYEAYIGTAQPTSLHPMR